MPPSIFCPDTTWTGTQILLSEQHCGISRLMQLHRGALADRSLTYGCTDLCRSEGGKPHKAGDGEGHQPGRAPASG